MGARDGRNQFKSWKKKKIKTRARDRLNRRPTAPVPWYFSGALGEARDTRATFTDRRILFLSGQFFFFQIRVATRDVCLATLQFFLAPKPSRSKAALDSSAPGLYNELLHSL